MKALLGCFLLSCVSVVALAGSTIDGTNKYAYGANIGWLNCQADTTNGAVIGNYICSRYIYSANVGWINLGSGSPTNGIYYQNVSSNDFGVNQDGLGNLRGYAYGANIGWINFESNGAPQANLLTGAFSGSVWSANCGWISLSNSFAYVQTDTLQQGTLATNGLPVAWLLTYFSTTNENPNSDPTGNGFTIAQDYIAGTNPNNPNDVLRITSTNVAPAGTNITITWASVPTRQYYVQQTSALTSPAWSDSGLGLIAPNGTSTSVTFPASSASAHFYRVNVVLPLSQ
jgi:hypothetical protein